MAIQILPVMMLSVFIHVHPCFKVVSMIFHGIGFCVFSVKTQTVSASMVSARLGVTESDSFGFVV
jgi:hypothetical protein